MINPQKLRALREKNNWTLDMLGGKCKPPVDRGTINRIEMGKRKPNSGTILRLATALGVQPEDLAEPPRQPERQDDASKSRFETAMLDSNRNALALVAHRYGVSVRTIIELAPMLFTLTAEQHLADRRADLAGVENALELAESKTPSYTLLFHEHTYDALAFERNAIHRRDLFLDQCDDPARALDLNYEFDTHAPYPLWLKQKLRETAYLGEIEWWWRDSEPRFTAAVDDALWLTAGDREIAEAIVKGHVAINQLQKDERGGERLLAGLRRLFGEYAQRKIESDIFFAEIFPELSKPLEVKP